MDADVIQALKLRASTVAFIIGKAKNCRFNGYWDDKLLSYDLPVPGTIRFTYNDKNNSESYWPYIEFRGVCAKGITDTVLGPPVSIGGTVVDAQTTLVTNESALSVNRSYDVDFSEEASVTTDIGGEVTAHITQKVSYGGGASPVAGLTEVGVSATARYSKQKGSSLSESRTTSTSLVVPNYTEASITAQRKVGKFEHEVTYKCDLEHEVHVHCRGKGGYREQIHTWSSHRQFIDTILKKSPDSVTMGECFRESFNPETWFTEAQLKESRDWVHRSRKPRVVTLNMNVEFEKSTTGSVHVTSKELLDASAS